jgi:hypothetical protein
MFIKNMMPLTAEALAISKGLCKLRPHIHIQMLAEFNFDLSCLHAFVDHALDARGVQGVEHITYPFLVYMDPVTGVRQKREQTWMSFSIFQKIYYRETFDLGDS